MLIQVRKVTLFKPMLARPVGKLPRHMNTSIHTHLLNVHYNIHISNYITILSVYSVTLAEMYSYGPPHMAMQKQDDQHEHIQQLCEDTGCCPEDLPRAMNDREEWRERVRDIRATSAI